VDNDLTPKYLFNKNDIPKTNPEETKTSKRPIIEQAQSFLIKDWMFKASNMLLIPLFPLIL